MEAMKRVSRLLYVLVCLFAGFMLVACGEPPQPPEPPSIPAPPDTEKPELSVAGQPSRVTTTSLITIRGTVSPDTTSLVYRLNGGDPQDLLPSVVEGAFSIVVEGLLPGSNTLVLEATDAAGNKATSDPITVMVVDLSGVWGTNEAAITACDREDPRYVNDTGYVLSVTLQQTATGFIGVVTTGIGGLYNVAALTGQMNEAGVLEAQVATSPEAEGATNIQGTLRLTLEGETLKSELRYQDGGTCRESDETPATTLVTGTLVKGVGVPPLPPDDGLEPNDDSLTATPIVLPYLGPADAVLIRGNEDWFRFEITTSSVITLELATPQQFSGFTLNLHHASGPLGEPRFVYNRSTFDTAWGVGPGTYYLQVVGSPFYRVADLPYSFNLRAEPTPDALFEPNNTAETAFEIRLPFTANLYLEEGDEDWFKFSLTTESTLYFGEITAGSSLYDGTLKRIATDVDFNVLDPLPAGTYYLRIEELGGALAYGLSLSAQPTIQDIALSP
jgi:hypothetical protein